MTGRQRRYEQLAWPEIQRLANGEGSTLIWPFGACEQHGPQHDYDRSRRLRATVVRSRAIHDVHDGHPWRP